MNKIIYICFFVLAILIINGCIPDNSDELKERERTLLAQYLRENNITVEPTASGLYYLPIKEGVGEPPLVTDLVEFEYTGELIDGTIFGTTDDSLANAMDIYSENIIYGPTRIFVGDAIAGLAEGFQLMKPGGEAKLIIPSDLAYGGNSFGVISRYSTLIITVELQMIIKDPVQYEEDLIRNFLLANGWEETRAKESGLYYIEHVAGTGDFIEDGDQVKVYYKGYFLDGRVFDSNQGDETPYLFRVPGEFDFTGWNEGIIYMKKGSVGTLILPPDLAYGQYGSNTIPPYMTLVFDMEIVDVIK